MQQSRIDEPPLYESPSELLVGNFTVFDISERNRKETLTGRANQFETLLGMLNSFQIVPDRRNDDNRLAVFLITTSARGGLRDSHTFPLNDGDSAAGRQFPVERQSRVESKGALRKATNAVTTVTHQSELARRP